MSVHVTVILNVLNSFLYCIDLVFLIYVVLYVHIYKMVPGRIIYFFLFFFFFYIT